MSSDSGSGRHKPRRKATRARGTRPVEESAPPPPPEPPRYAPRGGESPFWANAQPRSDSQAWADTQAHLEARNRADSTPQYAPRPAVDRTVPLSTSSSGGWVTQTAAPAPTPAPTRRSRQSTPAEDLAGLGAWATTPPERPAERPPATPAPVEHTPMAEYQRTAPETSRYDAKPAETGQLDSTLTSRLDAAPAVADRFESTPVAPNPSYTQPPVSAVADPRTARGATELSGPRTAAIRETAERANRPARRQAADSTAVDADGRPVSRAARDAGGKRRPFVAVAAVLLVITPISWILLHQPQNQEADASLPISRDDSYATPTTKPVDAPTTPPKSPKTPPVSPTAMPTNSVTPTAPPTSGPTDTPTTVPTTGSSDTPPVPTTSNPRPTNTPTNDPTKPPPPPPTDDGSMKKEELQLFNSINQARINNGCAALKRDSSMTSSARADAQNRADNNTANDGDTDSKATVGGDSLSADKAYDRMLSENKATVLNCGFTTMAVGRGTQGYKTGPLCGLLGVCENKTRVAWVATFR